MNYDRLTIKAQEAIQVASTIAQQKDHSEIGSEHLLFALLDQKDGIIPPLVERVGVQVSTLLNDVEELLDVYPRVTGNVQVALSNDVQKILAKAEKETEEIVKQMDKSYAMANKIALQEKVYYEELYRRSQTNNSNDPCKKIVF